MPLIRGLSNLPPPLLHNHLTRVTFCWMRHSRLHITLSHCFVGKSAAQATDTIAVVGVHKNVNHLPPLLLHDCREEDISDATCPWLMRERPRRTEGRAIWLRHVSALQHRVADSTRVSGTVIHDVISFLINSIMKQKQTKNDEHLNEVFAFFLRKKHL